MEIVKKLLSDLKKNKKNMRIHSEKQIDEYVRSVEMFGQIRPLVIDDNGVILAGNGLYDALVKIGKKEGDCFVMSGLTEAQKMKVMLADNKIYELGHTSFNGFDNLLQEIGDFDIPGFDEDLLKMIADSAKEADKALEGYGYQPPLQDDIEPRRDPKEVISGTASVTGDTSPYKSVEEKKPVGVVQVNSGEERPYVTCPKCGEKIWL